MSGGNGAGPASVDVAIVGGGIVGCSAAYRLAERGLKVALFERGTIASEQSSRAWGFVRQQGRHEAEVPLAAEANRLWIEQTARFGESATGFAAGGILVPAETEADEERVVSGHEIATRFQLRTRVLDRAAMRALVPELAGNWRSGLFTAGDAHAEPALSTQTIANAARAAGATINEHAPVIEIDTEGGHARGVVTAGGRCRAGIVLLASGIGTPRLARRLGHNLPIQVIRSSVGLTQAAKPFTKVAMWGPRVAYRPRADGSFTIGNGYRGLGADYDLTLDSLRNLRHFLPAYRNNWRLLRLSLGGEFLDHLRANAGKESAARALPEPRINRNKVARNVAAFNALFPHLGSLPLARAWAGRIDLTPDVIPIIDRPNPNDSLYLAAGFSGHGFALGPSIGKQLAEWIVDGRPSLDLNAFRLSRFAEGDVNRDKQAL
ncbi:MAG TPA: FAD-binding oxidoreductase [Xanthobacteraceae bacterium]|nr:FAD-binding oxidoreductase [Xanthobacteraceae bacterium]